MQLQYYVQYPGKVPWWRRVLGIVPKATLPKELGSNHNVTLQAFAHLSCVVSPCIWHARQAVAFALIHYPEPCEFLSFYITLPATSAGGRLCLFL